MRVKVIFKSAFWITVLTLMGSGLGFLNQVTIALYFGAQQQVDMYLFSISVPTFVAGIVATIISYSLVPKIAALSLRLDDQAIYVRTMLITIGSIAFIVGICGYFLSTWQVSILGKFDSKSLLIIQLSWLTAALQIIVSFLSALSTAHRKYYRPAIAALLPYLGMLITTILVGSSYGISVVSIGFLIGTFCALLYLAWSNKKEIMHSYKSGSFDWGEVSSFFMKGPLISVAMSCFSAYAVIDAHFAPLLGEANLSYLGYSQRILIGMGSLIIAGPSAILVPHFARMVAEGHMDKFRRETYRILVIVIVLSIPVVLLGFIYAEPIVRILFMRGAFDVHAVLGVAKVFSVMIVGMVPMLCVVILFRIFYCLDTRVPQAILGLSWSALYFLGSMIGSSKFSIIGIAYSYVGSWLVCLFLILILFRRTLKNFNSKGSPEHLIPTNLK